MPPRADETLTPSPKYPGSEDELPHGTTIDAKNYVPEGAMILKEPADCSTAWQGKPSSHMMQEYLHFHSWRG